ncbi:PKD domain-containing protein [Seonamhaeicola marinus]|uniref:PKD domain-containing protein n=1 Tax=Seonamhaeicola marinus TaxID=1912246 RepID=A0A5D0IKL3_9FLAO|nr:PKD domain-containing protein [Seonamhaeicola marinus]TYA84325.1 hypothetical protein FUA24_06675 [Seonamhaeicola marinus]
MKKIMKTFKYISVLILALAFIGCEEDDVVLPKVIAGFTYTVDIDNGVVTFINISENANTYTWNFGDGTSSTLINPVKAYENGTYTITLNANNVAGASNVFEDEITILIPEVATIPISFDGANTKYEATTFGGASFAIVDNPDPTGANTSTGKVAEITNSGAAWEGFYFDLGAPLDLSTLKTVKTLFWSNTSVDLLLKLEEGNGADVEVTASHGGTGWEEVYFTFDSASSFNRFTMFVDGPGTTAGKFYIDDISQIDSADIPCPRTMLELPIDFDCNSIDYAGKIVGNVSFEVVDNPELSGINADPSKVGKITNVGANWENAFFNLDTAIDFATDKGVKIKLFSDQALPVKLKFEDGTEDPVEADANHTGSGWEELSFTLASSASYNDMVLFVDGPGTAAGTFYIDNIVQFEGVVAEPCEAETMQSLSAADFNLSFMEDPTANIIEDGADFEWVDNPDFDNEINKSCKVGKITKLGNNPWDNNQIDLDAKLDFNANEGLKIKVWSPLANTEVRIKLEEIGNPGNNVEKFLNTSVTAGWEELMFPFDSADSDKFNKIVIFFDLNANNTDTYYFDDFALYGDGSGGNGGSAEEVILNFENNLTGITTSEFETGGGLIANPVSGGINTSANVYEASFNNGNQWWGGIGFVFADGLDQTTTVYKAKFYSTVAPTNVLFQVEVDGTNAPVGDVQQITTANEWVELTFTLANIPNGVNRVLVRPDVGDQSGTKPNTGSLYIDDITTVNDGGGSGGGGGVGSGGGCAGTPVAATTLPLDFEGCESFVSSFSSIGDGGVTTSLDANPSKSGINTSDNVMKVVRASGINRWGGIQNSFPQGTIDITTKVFKVKVYSNMDNVTYRFELALDPQTDPVTGNPAPVFRQVAGGANTWTEIEFTFINLPASPTTYNQLVIKPDNPEASDGETTSGEQVFYFDDLRLE